MKKVLFFLLLAPMISFCQESTSSVDSVNRDLLKYLKSVDVENAAVKRILYEKASEISLKTNDTILKNESKKYLLFLDNIKLPEFKKVIFSKVDKEKLKDFKVNEDKFKNSVFINHKKNTGNRIRIYIGINSNEAFLRLVSDYHGSDWIFMNQVILLIDGNKYKYEISNPVRDIVSGSGVKEKSDALVNAELEVIVKAIAGSKGKVEIRFSGENKVEDFTLSQREINCIQETLDIFNSF